MALLSLFAVMYGSLVQKSLGKVRYCAPRLSASGFSRFRVRFDRPMVDLDPDVF